MVRLVRLLIEMVSRVVAKLAEIHETLQQIKQTQEIIMATLDDFKTTIKTMSDELDIIVTKLSTTGMSAADEDAALADLQAFNEKLKTAAS